MRLNGTLTPCSALLEAENSIDWHSIWSWCPTYNRLNDRYWYAAGMVRHAITSYDLAGHIHSFHHGVFAALWGFVFGIIGSPFQLFFVSDKWARKAGSFGCLFGLVLSLLYFVKDILVAVLVFLDRVIIGITNGCFGKDFDYVLDPSWKASVHQTPLIASEMEAFLTQGIPKARRAELLMALDMVVGARKVFENAGPVLPKDHRHFVVVKLPDLLNVIGTPDTKTKLRLSDADVEVVKGRLNQIPDVLPDLYHHSSRRLISDKMGASRILQRISEESKSLLSEDGKEGEKSTPEAKTAAVEAMTSYQARLNELVQRLTPAYREGKPEESEVSFSLFIQALQPVCGRKCLQANLPNVQRMSYRNSSLGESIEKANNDAFDDFSEYLT